MHKSQEFKNERREKERGVVVTPERTSYSDAEKYLVVISDSGTGLVLTLSHTKILIV
jgi:hypothetical protein